jgi:hypothetical protein
MPERQNSVGTQNVEPECEGEKSPPEPQPIDVVSAKHSQRNQDSKALN